MKERSYFINETGFVSFDGQKFEYLTLPFGEAERIQHDPKNGTYFLGGKL